MPSTWSWPGARKCLREALTAGRPAPTWVIALAVALSVLIAGLPLVRMGAYVCDEFHQFLEPAWRMAGGGNSWIAWEWQTQWGLRNVFAPGIISLIIRCCHAIGLTDPWWIRCAIAVPLAILWSVIFLRLAAWCNGSYSPRRHAVAMIFLALVPAVLLVGGRTLSEIYSTCIYLLVLTALPGARTSTSLEAGAVGLGIAAVGILRYGSLPFAVTLIPIFAWQYGLRRSAWAFVGGGALVVFFGWLDAWTWGTWWHSFWAYLRYNRSEQSGLDFGFIPAWTYLPPLLGFPLLGLVAFRWWRTPSVLAIAGGVAFYLMLLLQANYKDSRFLIPVFLAGGTLGVVAIWHLPRQRLAPLLLASTLLTIICSGLYYLRQEISTDQVEACLQVARRGKIAAIPREPAPPFYPGAFWQNGAETFYTIDPDPERMIVIPAPPSRSAKPLPGEWNGVKFP